MKVIPLIVISFLVFSSKTVNSRVPNVCQTFNDYKTIKNNNTNCWYDLAAEYKVPDIIRMNGYPLIEYKVETEDGYILTLFRIPSNNNSESRNYPVYLQHGLAASCANFLGLGKNSLALVLADAGYDVWLGNFRGSQYSEEHINLTVYAQKYWDISFDDVVTYDLPAIFDTILENTSLNGKIIYIGHSVGTTIGLMYAAEFPEKAHKIFKMFVFLSPAYTLKNMISPYRLLVPYGYSILKTVQDLGMLRIASQAEFAQQILRQVCNESPMLMQLCLQAYNLFYGPNTQMGPEIGPVYFNQSPGGAALKMLNHAADLISGNFRKYNYLEENYKHYGSVTPPIYDIKKIYLPIYIFYSTQDWATTELVIYRFFETCKGRSPDEDALNLYYNLNKEARYGIKGISLKNFNHMDFMLGRHVRSVVYDDLVQILNKAIKKLIWFY